MAGDIVALIPVREGSQRVRDKNFRPFGEAPSLLHLKIRQVKQSGCFSHVYVSSDSERARRVAEECGVEFLPRDPRMCASGPRWDEVVVSILGTVPGDPLVAWTLVTSPLFDAYAKAVEAYFSSEGRYDSLVGVRRLQEYVVDEQGRPLLFAFGAWHPYTTEVKPWFIINDALYLAPKSDQLRWRYWFGLKPLLYEMSSVQSININFADDFEMAEAAAEYVARRQERS